MKMKKPKFWDTTKNNNLKFLLIPFSLIFDLIVFIRKKFSTPKKFSIKTICIGNIYLGGTGKTPLSIELLKLIKSEDIINKYKPVIIKKNYKNQIDEINLLKKKVNSVIVEKNRVNALEKAEREGYNLAILDDGLQDYSFYKNIKIVCFNDKLIGNTLTLPAGPLRENITSVKDYDIVLINTLDNKQKKDFEKILKSINPNLSIFYSIYKPDKNKLDLLRGKKINAFAGIGNPENFFSMLLKYELNIEKKEVFPDHFNFNINHLKTLIDFSKKNNQKLLTTEKDYIRIKNLFPGNSFLEEIDFLAIDLQILEKDSFINEIKVKI